jgi:hypothetical protein
MPHRAQLVSRGREEVQRGLAQGDRAWAPAQETAGMSACRLQVDVLSSCDLPAVLGTGCAGQGAHREVGSEGFAAKHRAVAEQGEPVGQIPGETEPALWRRRKYLEHLGASRCVRAARCERGMRYPGRSRSLLRPTGPGTWAYKPEGEVAGDGLREVGVASGTHEPGKSKSPGTVPAEGRRAATQKAPTRGKGPRREVATQAGGQASRRTSGLMVAAAMTEALALRTPGAVCEGAR